ncbi:MULTISPECIES: Holliday junction resolvase RuvX [Aedoeadaptatus]|uniref:Holliday junction resolvase RuvX n=1 Tax=Aedoeadaptatus TaxID=2981628 RepID=UPI000D553544|nr:MULTISPECIES: Holliday junction resolvase RuvX [Peptoniphilaceae]MBS6524443.1 Holliday junction resolvase RuvX [Peptoniphilaceae bacterium]MCU6785701.1 Holliday junction resolvase RuvX [Aedoeadaptatus acetigenes]
MKRLLGLDIGNKTIGVSVSDPLGITAQGVTTIIRASKAEDAAALKALIDKYDVEKLIVGLPKNMNNTLGFQAKRTMNYADYLKEALGMEIIYVDERLTTSSAEAVLMQGGVRRENRKKHVDKLAAVLILQTYLDQLPL